MDELDLDQLDEAHLRSELQRLYEATAVQKEEGVKEAPDARPRRHRELEVKKEELPLPCHGRVRMTAQQADEFAAISATLTKAEDALKEGMAGLEEAALKAWATGWAQDLPAPPARGRSSRSPPPPYGLTAPEAEDEGSDAEDFEAVPDPAAFASSAEPKRKRRGSASKAKWAARKRLQKEGMVLEWRREHFNPAAFKDQQQAELQALLHTQAFTAFQLQKMMRAAGTELLAVPEVSPGEPTLEEQDRWDAEFPAFLWGLRSWTGRNAPAAERSLIPAFARIERKKGEASGPAAHLHAGSLTNRHLLPKRRQQVKDLKSFPLYQAKKQREPRFGLKTPNPDAVPNLSDRAWELQLDLWWASVKGWGLANGHEMSGPRPVGQHTP